MTKAEQIVSEALQLDEEARTEVAQRLLESLSAPDLHADLSDEELAREIRTRIEDVESGKVTAVSWEDVRAQLKDRFGR